ncbi:Fbd-associated f-box protein [Melia azedarach]|uniref:Fbd-associated f-box protein n=1 Tax=Melia azedarach TaxID=155640 RepID=A0ACC1YKA5_MELAZ|nr:Fbd-associated f-box protein [Melia azedarach]
MSKIRSQQQTSAEKDDDLISRLPDDIVVEVINRLGNITEAARTSVLSSRWRDLWTFSNNLNLDPPKNICKSLEEIRESRPNYINWVHKVLELHRASTINIFRIHYDLYHPHTDVLTNWIHKAISKRGGVQHFELRLNLQGADKYPKYIFPQECYDILKSPHHDHGLSFISSLKSLSLTDVNITGEILHFFVYKCPLLERLRVAHSCAPEFALRIVGPSIRLKYIEFDCCFSIREVEISVPSLLSFKFYGSDIISLKVGNVPQLVDVSIGGNCNARLKNYIEPIINYLPQLHTLEFRLLLYSHPTDDSEFPFCELPNLRHLIFWVGGNDDHSLLGLTRMIQACPSPGEVYTEDEMGKRLALVMLVLSMVVMGWANASEYAASRPQDTYASSPQDAYGAGTGASANQQGAKTASPHHDPYTELRPSAGDMWKTLVKN